MISTKTDKIANSDPDQFIEALGTVQNPERELVRYCKQLYEPCSTDEATHFISLTGIPLDKGFYENLSGLVPKGRPLRKLRGYIAD
jgi:hypothetical protein